MAFFSLASAGAVLVAALAVVVAPVMLASLLATELLRKHVTLVLLFPFLRHALCLEVSATLLATRRAMAAGGGAHARSPHREVAHRRLRRRGSRPGFGRVLHRICLRPRLRLGLKRRTARTNLIQQGLQAPLLPHAGVDIGEVHLRLARRLAPALARTLGKEDLSHSTHKDKAKTQ